MKRLAVAAGVLLAAVFVALAIAVYTLDPRMVAQSLAASVKAETGRELGFGDVQVRLLPRPALVLSEVRFANAEWGTRPWMAEIGTATAGMDAPALLAGRVRIERIALEDASVFLETDARGRGNWVMGAADQAVPAWLERLEIDRLVLDGLALAWRDGRTGRSRSVRLESASIGAPSASGPMQLGVRASLDGTVVEAEGSVGALAALLANAPAWPVALEGRLGDARLSVRGTVDGPRSLDGFALALRVEAPQLADLGAAFGASLPRLGPVRGTAQLGGTRDAPKLSEIDAELGDPDSMGFALRGALAATRTADGRYAWRSGGLDLHARGAQLAELGKLVGEPLPALGRYRIAARAAGTTDAPEFSGIEAEIGDPKRMGFTVRGELAGSRSADGRYAWRSGGLDLLAQGSELAELGKLFGKSLPALGPYRIAARGAGTAEAPALAALDAAVGGGSMPRIRLTGTVANLRAASGVELQVAASATDWWRPGAAADAPRLPPFAATARVRDAKDGYRADALELRVADSVVTAALELALNGPRPRVTGKAAAPLIQLGRLLPPGEGGKAAGGWPYPGDAWKRADLDLDLSVGRLVLPDGRALQSASGRLALEDGRLRAGAVQAVLGGASVRAEGSIADPGRLAGLDLQLAVQGGELAELLEFFGRQLPPVGAYRGEARVQGSRDALRLSAIDAAVGAPGQRLQASGEIEDATRWQGVRLAIKAEVGDSVAAGRVFGADWPRLPALRATARVSGPQDGWVFDDLSLALGRTSVQGRVVVVPGEPRPRVTASLAGPLVDLSELPQAAEGAGNPLLAADADARIRFDRVVLPDGRALAPVEGGLRLAAGSVELERLAVGVDGASATLDGRIADPLKPAGLDLAVDARITHGRGLAALSGVRLVELPAFTASGRVSDVPGGSAIAGLKVADAATTIAGELTLTRAAERFRIAGKLTSPLLDLSGGARREGPAAAAAPGDGRAIPDLQFPLEGLRAVDADLDLRIDAVRYGDAADLGPLLVRADLDEGRLRADAAELTVQPGQTLSVSGTVDAGLAAWALRIEGRNLDLGNLLTRLGRPGVVTGGRTDLLMHFKGRGKSLREIAGSLDGEVRIEVGPHRVHNFSVPLDTGIFLRMFSLANPFRKTEPDTDVTCFAADLPIRDGVITSERRLAAETTRYNVVMSGTVNLRTEAIDAVLMPFTKGGGLGAGQAGDVVSVRGTLAAPSFGVDPVSVVTSAAALGAGVVAPVWMIADALRQQAASDPSPCATALGR